MSEDLTDIESALRDLRPAPLRTPLLDRLEACATGSWAATSPSESHLEHSLAAASPAALSPALMASLEAAVSKVPFPAERNIVLFPHRGEAAPQRSKRWMAAAAVVALSGALAALSIPVTNRPGNQASHPVPPPQPRTAAASPGLIPAGFERNLSEARDEGVLWADPQQAHRVLKVVYKDRVKMKDSNGRIYEVEQPRVEYILVPEKID